MRFLTSDQRFFDEVAQVKRGHASISSAWTPLVNAFQLRFGFAPLWVDAEWASRHRQRQRHLQLEIVVERTVQYQSLNPGDADADLARDDLILGWFDSEYHGRPPRVGWQRLTSRRLQGGIVNVQDFEAAAQVRAHQQVSDQQTQAFTAELGLGDRLVAVHRSEDDGLPRLFVRTMAQADEITASGAPDQWAMRWYELAKPHDEFGYLTRDDVRVTIDSEQNVIENHAGDWYYYWNA